MAGRLHHSPAEVIKNLLIDKGMGTDPSMQQAWPVFAAGSPDKPDSAMVCYDSEPYLDGRTMVDGETQLCHGFMVQFRSAGFAGGYDKANAVADFFDRTVYLNSVNIGSAKYLVQSVSRKGDVRHLGKEPGTNRSLFTLNATVTVRQTA